MTDKHYWTQIKELPDEHGGTVLNINTLDTSGDTVTSKTLLKGVTAHNAQGDLIVGEHECSEGTDSNNRLRIFSIKQRYRSIRFVRTAQQTRRIGVTAVKYGGTSLPYYEGDYIVDPKFTEIVLPTNGHIMMDDVTVHPILVSVTENLSGGNTVYIGME